MRTTIAGKLVRLRPIEHADLPTRAKWTADDDLARLMGVDVDAEPFISPDDELRGNHKWLDGRIRAGGIVLAIEAASRYIGDIDVTIIPRKRTAELSLFIGDRSQWGKGYGTETVELVLGELFAGGQIDAVEVEVPPANTRSLRFWQKLGFLPLEQTRESRYLRFARKAPA